MIKYTVANRVGEIVIGRASAGSAFAGEMVRQLGEIMLKAAAEADIVTLKGEGGDFSIGRDRQQPPTEAPFDAFRHISALNKAAKAGDSQPRSQACNGITDLCG
jgi:enoyl-CoA hydratase/carnithine racemase